MVIGEDMAAALWIVGEEWGGGGGGWSGGKIGGKDGGDLPRTVCTLAPVSHSSPSTISPRLAELIMEKWGNGTLETHLRLAVKIR